MNKSRPVLALLLPLIGLTGCVLEPDPYGAASQPGYGYPAGYAATGYPGGGYVATDTYPTAVYGGETVYLIERPSGWGYWDRQRQWRPAAAPHPDWRERQRSYQPVAQPHFQPGGQPRWQQPQGQPMGGQPQWQHRDNQPQYQPRGGNAPRQPDAVRAQPHSPPPSGPVPLSTAIERVVQPQGARPAPPPSAPAPGRNCDRGQNRHC